MTTDYPYIFLTCCLCLLCIVVLAIVGVVIYFVIKKRGQTSPPPLPPIKPESPTASETVIIDQEAIEATVAAPRVPETAEAPATSGAPVEAYAAETIVSSAPLIEPTPEEKPANPFQPGSVAASSWNVGFDVRELYRIGFTEEEMHQFTQEEIQAVLDNVISLDELRKRYQSS